MGNGLADRVNARAQVAQRNGGGAVEQANPEKTLRAEIERMSEQFAMAMPRGFEAKQLIRDAYTLIRQNPQLALCVPQTVLGGLMTFAQLGLRPGVMGQGWLIPFKNWKQGNRLEAQIVIGYQGYVELVHRSGAVDGIIGRAVHANDEFRVEFGLREDLQHRPPALGQDRGDVVAYYAVMRIKDADPLFWVMSKEEAIAWRNHHAMGVKRGRGGVPVTDDAGNVLGAGPWWDFDGPPGGTGFDQMAIKTCFLRAKRWAPKSTDRMLTAATEVDGAVRMGFGDPRDIDEMLDAQHPEPPVIDAEAEEAPAPAPQQERERVTVTRDDRPLRDIPADRPSRPVSDLPAEAERVAREKDAEPAAPAGDAPANDAQGRAIAAIMRQGLGKTPSQAERRTLLGGLIGRTVESQKDVTVAEASRAIDLLNGWQKAGDLGDRLRAMLGTAAGEPPAEDLPTPGSAAWHEQGHPTRAEGGQVTRVPVLMTGECGICEQPEDDPRDEADYAEGQLPMGGE